VARLPRVPRSRLLFTVAMLCGSFCSALFAQNVEIEFDRSVDFSHYKTFAVRDGEIRAKSAVLNNDLTRRNLEFELAERLKSRGLTEIKVLGSGQQPDLNVRYHLGADTRRETDRLPIGPYGRRSARISQRITEGTLVIELHDVATKSLVWQAVVNEDDPNSDKLAKMVKKAIDKYPPKK
jgi:hypothetical protein